MSIVKPSIQYPVLIAYLEGANNYTWVHFRNGEKRLLAKPISYLEEQPELIDFIRMHKTALVNPDCVERLIEPPRPKMAGAVQITGGVVLPVSRRRWVQVAMLLRDKLVVGPNPRSRLVFDQRPAAQPATLVQRLVLAVTSSAHSALLLTEVASKQWPASSVHILSDGAALPTLLRRLPRAEIPILLLLDARTNRQERLNALDTIKRNHELSWIPVVLLVSPADAAVHEGYHRRANSVITLGEEHTQFVQTIKRVYQFWLETAALPQ